MRLRAELASREIKPCQMSLAHLVGRSGKSSSQARRQCSSSGIECPHAEAQRQQRPEAVQPHQVEGNTPLELH